MADEIRVPGTEAGRAAAVAELGGSVAELARAGRQRTAIDLLTAWARAFRKEAPGDELAVLEILLQAPRLLHEVGEVHAFEGQAVIFHQAARAELRWQERAAAVVGETDGTRVIRARRALATAAEHLAHLRSAVFRRPDEARACLEEALALRAGLPGDAAARARTTAELALTVAELGDPAGAARLIDDAMDLARGADGFADSPEYPLFLMRAALVRCATGRSEEGEDQLREAVELSAPDRPGFVVIAATLADRLLTCGCVLEADVLLHQAGFVQGRSGATADELLAEVSFAMGLSGWGRGDLGTAAYWIVPALPVLDRILLHRLQMGAEEDRLDNLARHRTRMDQYLSLALRAGSPELTSAAFASVQRRKGIIGEIAVRQNRDLRSHRDDEVREQQGRVDALRDRLAGALPAGLDPEQGASMIDELRAAEAWTGVLSRLRREGDQDHPLALERPWWEQLADVGTLLPGRLPERSVLVEYVSYLDAEPWGDTEGRRRYAAFVLKAGDQPVQLIGLGDAGEIDRLATDLLGALDDDGDAIAAGKDRDFHCSAAYGLGDRVRIAVLDPVLSAVGEARVLLLAPDAGLAKVPFAALPLGEGFVVDRYDIGHLACGRDLVMTPVAEPTTAPAVVLADPDVELGGVAVPREAFGRLPGARAEGIEIGRLLGVPPLLDDAATETALRAARSPAVLHIAAHGWFLPEAVADEEPSWARHPKLKALRRHGFRGWGACSGLVLTGFNAAWAGAELPDDHGDGLLTADDAAALELAGTELVTLSACDTGRGRPVALEGLFGLRRAFVQAGARAVLSTQWAVPDEPSRELMKLFYRRLLTGVSRTAALAGAQRALRKKYPHPDSWAAFQLYGEPGPLAGPALASLLAVTGSPDAVIEDGRAVAAEAWLTGDRAVATRILCAQAGAGDRASAVLLASCRAGDGPISPGDETILADAGAAAVLGEYLAGRGDPAGAEHWLRRAIEGGSPAAAHLLGTLLSDAGREDDAAEVWAAGAARGDAGSLHTLGVRAANGGDLAAARTWWRRAADAGAALSARYLADTADLAEDATTWRRRAAMMGDPESAHALAGRAYAAGDLDEAIALWLPAARAGDVTSAHNVGVILDDLGRPGADHWLRRAVDGGSMAAANRLGRLLEARGDDLGARWCGELLAESGHPGSARNFGRYLLDHGDRTGAARWLEQAAGEGDPHAMYSLALIHEAYGRDLEAADLTDRAAAAGQPDALVRKAQQAWLAGRRDEVYPLVQRAAQAGSAAAAGMAGDLWAEEGDLGNALALWRKAADAGHDLSAVRLARELIRSGDRAEALRVLGRPAGRGDELATALARALRGDSARRAAWARAGHRHAVTELAVIEAAETGSPAALVDAAAAVTAGEPHPIAELEREVAAALRTGSPDAQALLTRSASAGSATNAGSLGMMLIEAGRVDEGAGWLRRARELARRR